MTTTPYPKNARSIAIGETLVGDTHPVAHVATTGGVTYVWLTDDLNQKADHVFNHGDPVKVFIGDGTD